MTKDIITRKLTLYQVIASGILLFLIVGDEVFDFPHIIFGAPATPINWIESFIEGMYILVLSGMSLYLSQRLLNRIKHLEGILPICSFCKKIEMGGDWKPIEEYIKHHSAADFSQPNGAPVIDQNGNPKPLEAVCKDWIGQNSFLLAASNKGGSDGQPPKDQGAGGKYSPEQVAKMSMAEYDQARREGKI